MKSLHGPKDVATAPYAIPRDLHGRNSGLRNCDAGDHGEVIHGKTETAAAIRDALAAAIVFAELLNVEMKKLARVEPCGSIEGFKRLGQPHDKTPLAEQPRAGIFVLMVLVCLQPPFPIPLGTSGHGQSRQPVGFDS